MGKRKKLSNFIFKLNDILNNEKENATMIHWNSSENGFVIENFEKLRNIVLPKYFKHHNYASFVRQLNLYDFHKTKNDKLVEFIHKKFQRNQLKMIKNIKRKKKSSDNIEEGNNAMLSRKFNLPENRHIKILSKKLNIIHEKFIEMENVNILLKNSVKELLIENKIREKKILNIVKKFTKSNLNGYKLNFTHFSTIKFLIDSFVSINISKLLNLIK